MPRSFSKLPLLVLGIALTACDAEPVAVEAVTETDSRPQMSRAVATPGAILAEIRRATARYHRLEVALADGYVFRTPCHFSATGGKGHHYRKVALTDGVVDPSQPEILLYEPLENGTERLVGVSFLVPAAAWDPFNTGPPVLGDQPFMDRRAPGSLGPPFPNYALFVWVWRHNSNGMFEQYNPDVSCEFSDAVVFE
jgi:hypothetical protein